MRNAPPAPPTDWDQGTPCTAFDGDRRVAAGPLAEVAAAVRRQAPPRPDGGLPSVLIFDDATARQIEVDFRGSARAVVARLPKAKASPPAAAAAADRGVDDGDTPEPRGPGRPRLGVVGREVTLLPRQWDWLNAQPGGASVALRKLVRAAEQASGAADRRRRSQEAAYRFMVATAGNRPGFEEATRALFAGDAARFRARTARWPRDVRDYARRLAADAM